MDQTLMLLSVSGDKNNISDNNKKNVIRTYLLDKMEAEMNLATDGLNVLTEEDKTITRVIYFADLGYGIVQN